MTRLDEEVLAGLGAGLVPEVEVRFDPPGPASRLVQEPHVPERVLDRPTDLERAPVVARDVNPGAEYAQLRLHPFDLSFPVPPGGAETDDPAVPADSVQGGGG